MLAAALAPRRDLMSRWTDWTRNANAWRLPRPSATSLGNYHDALAAYRRAKQYDRTTGRFDNAVERAQRGIITEFSRAIDVDDYVTAAIHSGNVTPVHHASAGHRNAPISKRSPAPTGQQSERQRGRRKHLSIRAGSAGIGRRHKIPCRSRDESMPSGMLISARLRRQPRRLAPGKCDIRILKRNPH